MNLDAPLHGPNGLRANIVLPKIRPNVTFTGPAGVDENGHPITWKQKNERRIVNELVFQGLKANGYDYKKHREELKKRGVKTQLDYWKEKTEETRKYIEKNGPITTKNFVLPGSTPELSAQLNNPEVGVRIENGKRVYYLNGKRLDPYAVEKTAAPDPAKTKPGAITRETTHVSASRRRPAGPDEAQTPQGKGKTPERQAAETVKKTTAPSVPKAASNTPVVPAPEDAPRRPSLDTSLNPNAVPSIEEMHRKAEEQIDALFPDLKKQAAPKTGDRTSFREMQDRNVIERTDPSRLTPVSRKESLLAGVSGFLLRITGIGEAQAGERSAAVTEADKADVADETYVAFQPSDLAAAQADPSEFSGFADEITKRTRTLQERFKAEPTKRSASVQNASDEAADANDGDEENSARAESDAALPTYLDEIEHEGVRWDPTQFAAAVVNATTKSLTESQFNEDVDAVVGAISNKEDGAAIIASLEDILDSYPEIRNAIPDADERLAALRGDQSNALDGSDGSDGSDEQAAPEKPLGETTYIFVSYSLSEDVLKDIISRQAGRRDVALVMRGVPEGMDFLSGVKRIQELAAALKPSASVIIDPPLFTEYGITHVPAVVRVGRTPSKLLTDPTRTNGRRYAPLIAKVEGLHNDRWLLEKIEAGEKGDLGQQGDVHEIAEPDLIEVMKDRVTKIDWQKKKEEAAARFWEKREYRVFPTASEERVREIDPTILVERDIKDLAGRPIRRAGDRVNPLQIRPFTQTMLIFNPLSEDEMERVLAFQKAHKAAHGSNLVLIATQMANKEGWDGYVSVTDRLDSHVFLMTPEIEERWEIEKTPAVVTADNRRHVFLVHELGPLAGAEPHKQSDQKGGKK
ncbi:TrbC family F-type conjugative pilus assembly protein [Sutterella sp.]|uniref:TrbC family F-type conjugative pilus assembly protein n=1 Tax=Sutterella sp. TaxID=1981025 RepID=UPI003FD6D8AF